MSSQKFEKALKEAEEIFSTEDPSRYDILVREILLNALKLKKDTLDILDLKIMNRSLRELRYAFKVFKPYRNIRKVSIFGSARTPKEDPYYKMAVDFAKLLAEEGFMVITGAASGIMRAGNEGAGKGRSFGVNILLPMEQGPNEFIVDDPLLVTFKYFFTRKLLFIMESSAVALFPGGFGTHDEGFETLTLLQTQKASLRPLILLDLPGEDYWEQWDGFVREQLLGRGMISEEDLSFYSIQHSAREAVDEVKFFYSTYHSTRMARGHLVVRLERELSDGAVGVLNEEFKDIVETGAIEKSPALKEEENEPELANKPRLIFSYNRKNAARLTQMVHRINELGKGHE